MRHTRFSTCSVDHSWAGAMAVDTFVTAPMMEGLESAIGRGVAGVIRDALLGQQVRSPQHRVLVRVRDRPQRAWHVLITSPRGARDDPPKAAP